MLEVRGETHEIFTLSSHYCPILNKIQMFLHTLMYLSSIR